MMCRVAIALALLALLSGTGHAFESAEQELRHKAESTQDNRTWDWLVSEARRRGIATADWKKLPHYPGGRAPTPRSKPSPITRASDWSAVPSFEIDPRSTGIVLAVLDPDPTLSGARGHPFLRAVYEAMLDARTGVGFDLAGEPANGGRHQTSVLAELEAHPNIASATITDDTGTAAFDDLFARGLPILSYATTVHCECDYDFEKVVVGADLATVRAVFGHHILATKAYWDAYEVWYVGGDGRRISVAEKDGTTEIFVYRGV